MWTLAELHSRFDNRPAQRHGTPSKTAQVFLTLGLVGAFCALTAKMVFYATATPNVPVLASITTPVPVKSRPDIVDRHGRLLATDIRVYRLYANPQQLVNADEAAEKIVSVFPDLNQAVLASKFRNTKSTFEWVKLGFPPRLADAVQNLGIPGFHIVPALQRVYPAGNAASHILGLTDAYGKGMSGIEKYIDTHLLSQSAPLSLAERPIVKLSIDLGIQHAITEELALAKQRYNAEAVLGLVLDVANGEVIASASLPDFDPNRRDEVQAQTEHNRVVTHSYELGSVFKAFTIAMALDQGLVSRNDRIDAATPLHVGRFVLKDKHARREPMSIDDIFIHSSNTGTARLALLAGAVRQRQFLENMGFFNRLETEAGLSRPPKVLKVWRPANAITIAYGHGIATPPLQFASAAATLVNGGFQLKPTFLLSQGRAVPREAENRLITQQTSETMRDLMRLTVLRGTGRRAMVPGVSVGGKTGTALKAKKGQYTKDVLNSFVAAFPIENPKYLLLVTLDEPKPEKPGSGNEAAYNAAPTAGAIITRIAPMLDILHAGRFDVSSSGDYEKAQAPQQEPDFSRTTNHETGGPSQKHTAFNRSAYSRRDDRIRYYGGQPSR